MSRAERSKREDYSQTEIKLIHEWKLFAGVVSKNAEHY
jgi:hypothetical protein